MDTILSRLSSTCSDQLLLLLLLGISLSCLNVVSSITMQDQTPSATEFGGNYYKNLISSTIKDENLNHITEIHIMPEWPAMLIGANNTLYVFDLNHELDISRAKRLEWVPDEHAKTMCYLKGKEEEDCQNYIKVIAPNEMSGRLFICGTYAQKPSCVDLEVDMSNLESQWENKGDNLTDGLYKCPFNKDQTSTAVFANGSLYAGTVADFSARESVLTRSLGNTEIYPPLITKQSDSIWLNLPEFIKSYQEGNEVLFFFREIAIETQYTGKMYYSRIARVCTNDKGGSTILDFTWTTFLKARLDCSFHGDFPFHFNYLQDVTRVVEWEKVLYYGIFTTGDHEIPASAVCRFNLDTIRDNFNNGLFKQTTAPWQPVPDIDVPSNRPGSCSAESTELPYEDLDFIKSHPLMYEPVENSGQEDPLFTLTRSSYRLKKLVTTTKGPYNIVFAGTDDGHVIKLVLRENHPVAGEVSPVLLYNMHVMEDKQPITNMRLYKNRHGQEVIFVTSKDVVVELSLQHCQYLKNCSCKQDPYCKWIERSIKCIVSTNNEDYSEVELDCKDTETPAVVSCPMDIERESSQSTITVTWEEPEFTDNSGENLTPQSNRHSGSQFYQGEAFLVSYKVEDAAGNIAFCNFSVKVKYNVPPVFQNCPLNINASTDPLKNTKVVTWDPLIFVDNSGDKPEVNNITNTTTGQEFEIGQTLVKFTARDAQNNKADCTFSVMITDDEPPVFQNCPLAITASTDTLKNTAVVTWDPLITVDNSGDKPEVNNITKTTTGQEFEIGQTLVKFTARDAHKNKADCTFNVTIIDKEPPVFQNCPLDIIASTDPLKNTAVVTWAPLIVVDNSERIRWIRQMNMIYDNSGNLLRRQKIRNTIDQEFVIGRTLVKFITKDAHNNKASCRFNVTVRASSCPFQAPPTNGAVAYDSWSGGQIYRIYCHAGYQFSRTPEESYFCSDGEWVLAPPFNDTKVELPWPDCSAADNGSLSVGMELQYFTGSCPGKGVQQVQEDFFNFSKILSETVPGFCGANCSAENVKVTCGPVELDSLAGRRKRQSSLLLAYRLP